jgi:hypothetical protein
MPAFRAAAAKPRLLIFAVVINTNVNRPGFVGGHLV